MGFATVLNKTEIDAQYNELVETIKSTFGSSERTDRLVKLYTDYEERIKESPASGKTNFHSAYEGGYLFHILNVLKCAKMVKKLYAHLGGTIDFTDEELVFCALHHDLGKLGTLKEPYYVVQDSEWHRTNHLEMYKHNPDRQYMRVNDLTFYVLQLYGITITQNEYLAMKLTDGLYDEANIPYLKQYGSAFPMRCNLHKIMQWADYMASSLENDIVREQHTKK